MNGKDAKAYYSAWDVEADTVIGRVGGKCLLTIIFVPSQLFLARPLEKKTQECVVAALDELERIFKRYRERLLYEGDEGAWWFFSSFLTDNGVEMNDFASMERTVFKGKYDGALRMAVYYCDPYCSWQKPHIEVAHTLLRRVLPKGTSFDDLCQQDIDLICSHINSYGRDNLNGATPYDVTPPGFCGDGILKALGLEMIRPDDVQLNPGLLSR